MKVIPTKFLSRAEAEGISSRAKRDVLLPGQTVLPPALLKLKVGLVSVISPDGFGGAPVTDPELDGFWHAVMKLRFHDVDPTHCSPEFAAGYTIFSEEDAERVLDFLLEHEAAVDEFWFHCEAGVSRSAAGAKYIAYAYGSYFPDSYSLYNKHVFTMLKKAHDQRMYTDKRYPGESFHKGQMT